MPTGSAFVFGGDNFLQDASRDERIWKTWGARRKRNLSEPLHAVGSLFGSG